MFYLCLIFTSINLHCGENQKLCELNNKNKIDSISLSYPNEIKVTYQIKENFVDVSSSIIFRYSGPDEVKKYINGCDTLEIRWYWNNNQYGDDRAKEWIVESYSQMYPSDCPQTIKDIYFNQLQGTLSEIICPDPTRMVFIGINEASNYLVVAYYNTNSSNKCAKEEFIAIINSMVFHI
ncbi:MAG: hypothetical protein JNN28_05710 [Saprospiraceae bacterium]|nr:hypothetical protein [Saprospiraceae bacterium]